MAVEFDDLLIDWIGVSGPTDNPTKNVRNFLEAIQRVSSKEAIDFLYNHPEFSWEVKLGAVMGCVRCLSEFALKYTDTENPSPCPPTESA